MEIIKKNLYVYLNMYICIVSIKYICLFECWRKCIQENLYLGENVFMIQGMIFLRENVF